MNKLPRVKIKREELPAGEVLCSYCPAKCCRYFSLPIERPETFDDFEYLRWYVLHEHATIFTEDDSWFLLVHTVCKHLQPDNRCGIYETRPKICQEYSTDQCEFEDEYTFDRYFESAEQIQEYANARFSNPYNFRTAKPTGLPIIG